MLGSYSTSSGKTILERMGVHSIPTFLHPLGVIKLFVHQPNGSAPQDKHYRKQEWLGFAGLCGGNSLAWRASLVLKIVIQTNIKVVRLNEGFSTYRKGRFQQPFPSITSDRGRQHPIATVGLGFGINQRVEVTGNEYWGKDGWRHHGPSNARKWAVQCGKSLKKDPKWNAIDIFWF